jgi:hypothetical protein
LFVAVAAAAAATVVTGGAALVTVGVAIGTYGTASFEESERQQHAGTKEELLEKGISMTDLGSAQMR